MFINELAQPQLLVIYPGRFQPFHKGHHAVYNYLTGKFGSANVFIATSNKTDNLKSPFTFGEKSYFMQLTGVPDGAIIECAEPYKIESILNTGRIQVDPANTVVIFAVSEKDMAEDPRFKSWTKKDGTPAFFQPLEDIKDTKSLQEHGYIMTVPTFKFEVLGQPMQSASELRANYKEADEQTRQAMIKDLFGKYTREAEQIMNHKLAPSTPVEPPRPTKIAKPAKPAGGLVKENTLNELDLLAPRSTYIKMGNGAWLQANYRGTQGLTGHAADDSTAFTSFKWVPAQTAQALGLDKMLAQPKKFGQTGPTELTPNTNYSGNGPLSNRSSDIVDFTDLGADDIPATLKSKLIQWVHKNPPTELNEKSVSKAQFRTMAAAAHNPEFAKKVGIKQNVAKEFHRADKKSNYKSLPKKVEEADDSTWLVKDAETGEMGIRPAGGFGTWTEPTLVASLLKDLQAIEAKVQAKNATDAEYLLYRKYSTVKAKLQALARYEEFMAKNGRRPIKPGREIELPNTKAE